MKIDELSFAAQVFDLADKLCENAFEVFKLSIDLNSPESEAKIDAWCTENNAMSHVPRAYSLITRTAQQIAQIRAGAGM